MYCCKITSFLMWHYEYCAYVLRSITKNRSESYKAQGLKKKVKCIEAFRAIMAISNYVLL